VTTLDQDRSHWPRRPKRQAAIRPLLIDVIKRRDSTPKCGLMRPTTAWHGNSGAPPPGTTRPDTRALAARSVDWDSNKACTTNPPQRRPSTAPWAWEYLQAPRTRCSDGSSHQHPDRRVQRKKGTRPYLYTGSCRSRAASALFMRALPLRANGTRRPGLQGRPRAPSPTWRASWKCPWKLEKRG
jgi:hypothetical protein